MIPSQRHLFDLPREVAYLNCAYMSPLMNAVVDAGRAGLARKTQPWLIKSADFFATPERARGLFARLIGAEAGDIATVPAASYGLAVAAANLPVRRGQSIVLLQDQFPSNVYPWRQLAADSGAEVVVVPRRQDGWTAGVLEAVDDRTAIVALPHCHWTDGAIVDLVAVSRRCKEAGAALALDLTQSAGALPFDAKVVDPDFAVAACYKWLMGPYSIGFLYVAPRHQAGRPLEHNWIARAGSEDFSRLIDYRMDFQPGARRFDVGEGANFALLPGAIAALERILEWGVEEIAATLAAKTEAISARVEKLGLLASPRGQRAGHFLGLRFPGGLPKSLLERLADENVFLSVRGDSLRVTPHLYNDEEDADRLVAALEKVKTGNR